MPSLAIDQQILDIAVASRTPALDAVITAFSNVGSAALSVPLFTAVSLALCTCLRSWLPVVAIAMTSAVSTATTTVMKTLINHPRPAYPLAVPPWEHSPSFPSGHTLNATALTLVSGFFALLAIHAVWLRILIRAVAVGYPIAMGISRVYLGHHWLSDVVGGWMIGAAIAVVSITFVRITITYYEQRNRPHALAFAPTPLPFLL